MNHNGKRFRLVNATRRRPILGFALVPLAALAVFAACGDETSPTPAATAAITVPPVPTITRTELAPTAAISATHSTATTAAATPAANRTTGIAEVDAIMAAILSGDAARIRPYVALTTVPCTNQTGLGGPPNCPTGVAERTLVDAFPSFGPSLAWGFDSERVVTNLTQITRIAGVFKAIPRPYSTTDIGIPSGSYVLVAEPTRLIHIDGGKIVFMDYVMGGLARRLATVSAADYLLPIQ